MEGLGRGMKETALKNVFDVGAEGSSGLIKYLKKLPSWETPFLCGHAKLLPGEVFVIKKIGYINMKLAGQFTRYTLDLMAVGK